jgi:hypothetical protein
LGGASEALQKRSLEGKPFDFYTSTEMSSKNSQIEFTPPDQASPAARATPDASFTYTWEEWRYNTFGVDMHAPQAGWLLIKQIYDPLWKLTLDGQPVQPVRANFVGMAIPLPQGQHQLRMDYRPIARSLYWPAGLVLEAQLIALFTIALLRDARASLPRLKKLCTIPAAKEELS